MRHVWTTGRARDHVVLADRVALVTEAQFAFALQDEEHLFFAMVAMERALGLAGGQHRQVVAQLLGADVTADLATVRRVEAVFFYVVERDLTEIHDGFHHVVLQ